MNNVSTLHIIDSHTGGEPTRVVTDGFPFLPGETLSDKLANFRAEYDHLRSAIVREPRGHDAIVGALLCEPTDRACVAAVIFFNNVSYLGMCGHGTIGLVKTLAYLGKLGPGTHKIETPVGIIEAELDSQGFVSVTNVPSYRFARQVKVEVKNYGVVKGDIAYGGNWFFLIEEHPFDLCLKNLDELTLFTMSVRNALNNNKITGADGQEIDHIELFSPSETADSRNFVLCPGAEYDRSPCGTGTSAKLACLYADGKIKEGDIWRQESIIGSVFEGRIEVSGEQIIPTIRGTAFITAESRLILDEADPFRFGIC